MGYATLGFPGGDGIRFRIDPSSIDWNFQVHTSVTQTIGGRVIQVMGATLSDITISGFFGEDRSKAAAPGSEDHPGQSWLLAHRFSNRIRHLMEAQSEDSTRQGLMRDTAVFSYPPMKWRFRVYIKAIQDPDGGVFTTRPGKFSYAYQLTLFIVQDGSDALAKPGDNNFLGQVREKAINDYIGRISEGIGWKPSKYNGNFSTYYDGVYDVTKPTDEALSAVLASAADDEGGGS